MKIYSTAQTRAWDAYTIENEPIASVNLMNRAVQVFTDWLVHNYPENTRPVVVFCGTGNNGGDGVAVARLLHWLGFDAKVVVCDFAAKRSADFEAQIALLPQHDNISIEWFNIAKDLPAVSPNALVIDALFGSGLNGPLKGEWAQVVDYLNDLPNEVVSIDLPSGLLADVHTVGDSRGSSRRELSVLNDRNWLFLSRKCGKGRGWAFGSIGLHPGF